MSLLGIWRQMLLCVEGCQFSCSCQILVTNICASFHVLFFVSGNPESLVSFVRPYHGGDINRFIHHRKVFWTFNKLLKPNLRKWHLKNTPHLLFCQKSLKMDEDQFDDIPWSFLQKKTDNPGEGVEDLGAI